MSQSLGIDPTVGKYIPQGMNDTPRVVADDEPDLPNEAYSERSYTQSEGKIVPDDIVIAEEDYTDTYKQLLALDLEGNTATANVDKTQPEAEQPTSTEPEYKEEQVDYTYLNMSEDFGVPDLAVNEADPEFQQWREGFKKFLGHDWDEYKQARTEMRDARKIRAELEKQKVQKNLDNQVNFIKQKWGVSDDEYHNRMQKVVEVFQKLDPTTQKILDRDPLGAVKLWKDIEMSEKINKPDVPIYEKSKPSAAAATGGDKPLFTGSQIKSMPAEQKAKAWGKILQASQNGLVDWNR